MQDFLIIEHLRMGNNEKAIKELYKEFPKVKANIISSGGNKEIAQEVFNDALLILIEKIENPSFELTSKISTYLYGIARLLWKNELRKQKKHYELEWADTLILSEKEFGYDFEQEERFQLMDSIIASLSTTCQDIFQRFYYEKQTMVAIAQALGFSSENSAKTQKYKCIERAMKLANTTIQNQS
jgi:RNA polymerase sigma factor (sigma-70 family)